MTRALTGRFGPTHALVVGEVLAHLDYLDEAIGRVSVRIDELMRPFTIEREGGTPATCRCPDAYW